MQVIQGTPDHILTTAEREKLDRLERLVDGGMRAFRQVGLALLQIRDSRLYRQTHGSFDEYLAARWNMHRSTAHRAIAAAEIASRLTLPIGDTPVEPTHESQVRPLSALPEEQQREAWEEAVRASGGAPTAADVQRAVDARTNTRKVMHSSETSEWYSPEIFANIARAVMGGIDLDPASSHIANETIRAAKFYTREDDGLSLPWHGRVFLNPPGGLDEHRKSITGKFVGRLLEGYRTAEVDQALLVCFRVPTGDAWFWPLWEHALCFLKGRTEYLRPDGSPGEQPSHNSALVYLGSNVAGFVEACRPYGRVVVSRGSFSEVAA